MKPYFSVIIPVYNVEKYLQECVDSILKQTFKNVEIILVDDGSTDSSPDLCDEISKNNECVCVIHKKNGGLSSARNTGLKKATGKYIIFIDSDDFYIDKDFLLQAKEELEKTDSEVLVFQRRKFYETTGQLSSFPSEYDERWKELNFSEMFLALSQKDKLDASAATKITKREFLISNDLFFEEGIFSEDVEWFFRYVQKIESITFLNNPAYGYRIREGSITHSLTSKNISNLFLSIERYADVLKDSKLKHKDAILNYMAYQYSIVIGLSNNIKDKTSKQILRKCKNYKWLIKYSISPKTKKTKFVIQMFGIKIASKILGFYIQNK